MEGAAPTPSAAQPKEEKPETTEHINLKVKSQDGNEIFFKIKRTTPLKKLMQAYCERQSVDMNSIAFLWDGARIRAEQTPDELDMQDGDEIDAMLHQSKRRNERKMPRSPPSPAVLTILCNVHRLEFYQLEGTEMQWNGNRKVGNHKLCVENQYQPIVV
mmetsp:Transcript_6219/g.38630  ORF Transcript_6219/g.38630 Transcript_6219/m.38630 type:complete len:159 (+) Transcript_6219:717-1193(+)